jgi:negative regulator of flagellin synthesis FlgM
MRIDGNNPVDKKDLYSKAQEVTENKKTDKKQDVQKPDVEKDKISLSGQSKEISELKAAIDELPDIRTDKVDSIKKAIDSGNYNVDSKKIAEKILEEL